MFSGKRKTRLGVAATETALLLPLMVTVSFASIEFANALHLRQSLTLGAYEAGTVLSQPQSELSTAEEACSEILAARKVQNFTLNVTPNPAFPIDPGTQITVTATAAASEYSMGPSFFMHDQAVTATIVVVRTP